MKSSGNAIRSARSRAANARAARTLSALPATSPTVGLSCATAIASRSIGRMVMALGLARRGAGRQSAPSCSGYASEQTQPLGQRQEPDRPGQQQGQANGGRAHVLDPPDLGVDLQIDPVGELLDR